MEIKRYEIKDCGVYLEGKKLSKKEARKIIKGFDIDQQLLTGRKPHRRLFEK